MMASDARPEVTGVTRCVQIHAVTLATDGSDVNQLCLAKLAAGGDRVAEQQRSWSRFRTGLPARSVLCTNNRQGCPGLNTTIIRAHSMEVSVSTLMPSGYHQLQATSSPEPRSSHAGECLSQQRQEKRSADVDVLCRPADTSSTRAVVTGPDGGRFESCFRVASWHQQTRSPAETSPAVDGSHPS
jgi:hypothetical protein